ncbi:VC0807 family protein [Alteromonas sp. a30]|uniref:VC0807 family protein n=1 Tax=Alteromonas sp. a30 TaxID=2730917 RepID=UPI002281CF6A|nr:VC0807 family protein [Alteromonas sp. a30]MCY7294488.1 MFS transporter [Alteromonas sp. a30]
MSENSSQVAKPIPKKGGLFKDLIFNIIIPTLILTKLSSDEYLGPSLGIVVALAFPIGYGLWDLKQSGKVNAISILGIISVFLTGGISLLELDPQYIAIKEAMIPGIIGVAVLISQFTKYPLVKTFILNDQVINMSVLHDELEKQGKRSLFEKKLNFSSLIVAASFFLSSALNYILAKWIVVSQPGTEAYNEELGKMTALSYPVIVLPSMVLLIAAIWYLFVQMKKLTGKDIEHFLNDL